MCEKLSVLVHVYAKVFAFDAYVFVSVCVCVSLAYVAKEQGQKQGQKLFIQAISSAGMNPAP